MPIKEDENSERTKRLYITTVLDVKSNVLVGWNITESPDSNSTLDALRFVKVNNDGDINDDILADVITKVNAAVCVSRSMKTEISVSEVGE